MRQLPKNRDDAPQQRADRDCIALREVAPSNGDLHGGERFVGAARRRKKPRSAIAGIGVFALRDLLRLRMDAGLLTAAKSCASFGRTIRCISRPSHSPNFGRTAVTGATWLSCPMAATRGSQVTGLMTVRRRSSHSRQRPLGCHSRQCVSL